MGDPLSSTGKRRAMRKPPSDTDENEAIAPENTLREVLSEQKLDTAARVAADRLLEEIASRHAEQGERISRLEMRSTWWERASRLAATISVAGVLSALAFVAAQLISHGDARAKAAQQERRLDDATSHIDKIRIQATADHALLQICASRLGVAPQGAAP
jgi:hypothetical protein